MEKIELINLKAWLYTYIKSKSALLAAQQANKLINVSLGQGIMTLFRKPADPEDGKLVSQRTILFKLESKFLL